MYLKHWRLAGPAYALKGLPISEVFFQQSEKNPTQTILLVVATLGLFSGVTFSISLDNALREPNAIPYLILAHLYRTMDGF